MFNKEQKIFFWIFLVCFREIYLFNHRSEIDTLDDHKLFYHRLDFNVVLSWLYWYISIYTHFGYVIYSSRNYTATRYTTHGFLFYNQIQRTKEELKKKKFNATVFMCCCCCVGFFLFNSFMLNRIYWTLFTKMNLSNRENYQCKKIEFCRRKMWES